MRSRRLNYAPLYVALLGCLGLSLFFATHPSSSIASDLVVNSGTTTLSNGLEQYEDVLVGVVNSVGSATLIVDAQGELEASARIELGFTQGSINVRTGDLRIINGGSVTGSSSSTYAFINLGHLEVTGADSQFTIEGAIAGLGAEFSVLDGASAFVGEIVAAQSGNSGHGVYTTVNGEDSQLTVEGDVALGTHGLSDTLEVSGNSRVEVFGKIQLLGNNGSTDATLLIDGGTLVANSLMNNGLGRLNFNDGELVVDGGLFDHGGQNLVLDGAIHGANPKLSLISDAAANNIQELFVGDVNNGELEVQAGVIVNCCVLSV